MFVPSRVGGGGALYPTCNVIWTNPKEQQGVPPPPLCLLCKSIRITVVHYQLLPSLFILIYVCTDRNKSLLATKKEKRPIDLVKKLFSVPDLQI